MDNISFGQYVVGDSWIYKIDPRMKIILTIALIAILFFIPTIYGMLLAVTIYFIMLLTTRIPVLKVIKGLRPMMMLLAFTFILQIIYTTGDTSTLLYSFDMQIGLVQIASIVGVLALYLFTKKYIPIKFIYFLLFTFAIFVILSYIKVDFAKISDFKFNIYNEGLEKASFVTLRIVIMVGITSLLTLSTMSLDINNGLEAILSPLKLIKIPVGIFSMLISLTLRFIPTLMNESKKIMNAQASRGVDFKEGSLISRINQIIALLIPMFVISFKKASDLSDAMEARGYVIGAKRTSLDELKLKAIDYISLVVVIIILGLVIWSNFNV